MAVASPEHRKYSEAAIKFKRSAHVKKDIEKGVRLLSNQAGC
jgi:hypothetical protein